MIYKLAPHIHFQGHDANIKNPSIKEVLDFFSDYDIITLAVHSTEVTEESYSSFVKECEKHSTPKKLIIPCLEDESKSYHLLLIGAQSYTNDVSNPNREHLTILAHPFGFGYHSRKIRKENLELENLDGIEVWNLYHNSKKYPSLKTLKFFRNFPNDVKACIGIDEHPPFEKRNAATFVNCETLTKNSVLKSLKRGDFYNQIKDFIITSDGKIKKDKKVMNKYFIQYLINEQLINIFSLLTYFGIIILKLLNLKNVQKHKIARLVKQVKKIL